MSGISCEARIVAIEYAIDGNFRNSVSSTKYSVNLLPNHNWWTGNLCLFSLLACLLCFFGVFDFLLGVSDLILILIDFSGHFCKFSKNLIQLIRKKVVVNPVLHVLHSSNKLKNWLPLYMYSLTKQIKVTN